MPDETELIEAMAKSLASRPTFEGVVIYCRGKRDLEGGKVQSSWGMATPKSAPASRTMEILRSVIGPLDEPGNLSTEALINELLLRPGFRGIVAQELGREGLEVTGRTEIRSHVPSSLELADAVEILRKAADNLERRIEL